MSDNPNSPSEKARLPSVHGLLGTPAMQAAIDTHGRPLVVDAARSALAALRQEVGTGRAAGSRETLTEAAIDATTNCLARMTTPSLVPVLNLTGTVTHTNLGRAVLPQEAIDAVAAVAGGAANLEYDLNKGSRGDRDEHVEAWLCRLTGAEAATVVNNNAAALMLVLNTLARRRAVIVSRGELIEIGGSFRLPEIMKRAGCRLYEIGTTNRTHTRDYEAALDDRPALVLKVHTSNYAIEGFSASAAESDIARLTQARDVPFAVDLGSGSLIDLTAHGLPAEPTPMETLANGADLVTFSGDKLLGGPQCGIVVGRHDLVARLKKNPMKRALRVDKMTLAALDAVLRLYADPDRAVSRIPALRLMTRSQAAIRATAEAVFPTLRARLDGRADIAIVELDSQIGSGALPMATLPSAGLAVTPAAPRRHADKALQRLARAFRALPVPVIGRIHDGALLFDLRCLEAAAPLLDAINHLPDDL